MVRILDAEPKNVVLQDALLALLRRHAGVDDDFVGDVVCDGCSDGKLGVWVTWPCADARLIAQMLGVEANGA